MAGLELLKESHHPTIFSRYVHCGSWDKMTLKCHVILQYHMIKWLCDFMGGASLW